MFDLSPFLNKSLITAYFKRPGKIPEDNDLLHIWVKGELMKGELIRSNFVDYSNISREICCIAANN
jgi:hypothetical protein